MVGFLSGLRISPSAGTGGRPIMHSDSDIAGASLGADSALPTPPAGKRRPGCLSGRHRGAAALLAALLLGPIAVLADDIRQEDLDSSLVDAAGHGDWVSFNLALGMGASLNAVKHDGSNAVLTATQGRQMQMLQLLLHKGVSPNILGGSGFTPLAYAAMIGDLNEVELLLQAGADPNLRDALGNSPLHLAAQFGHRHVLARLLAAGVRLDARNVKGETPLFSAIHGGHGDTFDALLAAGADPSASDRKGRSALVVAIIEEREAMALALVDKGADADTRFDGYTPLRLAGFMGYGGVLEALARRGAPD